MIPDGVGGDGAQKRRTDLARLALRVGRGGGAPAPFEEYRDDPVGFAREVLGIEPWSRCEGMPADQTTQVEILECVRDHNWVSCRSGHKVSKSNSASVIALWWVMTRRNGRVTLTAPANHQVENILWMEIRLLFRGEHPAQKKKPKLPGHLYVDCRSGLQLADGWGIVGLTTDTAERMSGKSGSEQLYLVDEASGYPEDIFTAIFGNVAGGGKIVLFGNPTKTSGTFYDSFNTKAAQWKRLHVASTSTPNFFGAEIPGLAGPAWHAWALENWGGPGQPLYDVRVLGRFPAQGTNAVVAIDLVDAAEKRWATTSDEGELDLGVDVAREGDDESVIAIVRGLKLIEFDVHRGLDGPGLGEKVIAAARRHARDTDQFRPRVKVDSIGVGTSVFDYLAHNFENEIEVIGVNSACAADNTRLAPGKFAREGFLNLRAQMGFGVAKWLADGGAIPTDPKLYGELVAPTFFFARGARLAIEEKKEIKKRLKRSPDRGDALALAIYDPPPQSSEVGVTIVGV